MAGLNTLRVLTLIITVLFVFIAPNNFKDNGIGSLLHQYYLEITPASWTFYILLFIHIWQAVWIAYTIVFLFWKTDQEPIYTNPVLLPASFLGLYIANLVLNYTWVVVFTSEFILTAFAALFSMTLTLVIMLAVSYKTLDQNIDTLVEQERQTDITLIRAYVHNGLALYGTWCLLATLLNLAIVLAYFVDGIDQKDASTVALSILVVVIPLYTLPDIFLLDRYSRYTLTPYVVFVVALVGSLSRNYVGGERNTVITMALLAGSCAATLIKFGLMSFRHFNATVDNGTSSPGIVTLPGETSGEFNEELQLERLELAF